MALYRLSTSAQGDLVGILSWTHENFGDKARKRYEALIVTALRDIASQPNRPGSIERPELGEGVRSWHLKLSKGHVRTKTGLVRQPRHFLIYHLENRMVVVGRVLHEAMESARHVDSEESGE